jgi:hypothetical protein
MGDKFYHDGVPAIAAGVTT